MNEDSLKDESIQKVKESSKSQAIKVEDEDAEYKESSSEFDDPDESEKPRISKEYKQRKDVVQKTILRKCRRFLQDEFNQVTNYYTQRSNFGAGHLRSCILQYISGIDFFAQRSDLNLEFYLGNYHLTLRCYFISTRNDKEH